MKRVLNLNEPGTRWAGIGIILAGLVPLALLLGSWLLRLAGLPTRGISILLGISMAAGLAILAVLAVLIILEQIQDHLIDKEYQKNGPARIRLANGCYECQYCGNRQVRQDDRSCAVCHHRLP